MAIKTPDFSKIAADWSALLVAGVQLLCSRSLSEPPDIILTRFGSVLLSIFRSRRKQNAGLLRNLGPCQNGRVTKPVKKKKKWEEILKTMCCFSWRCDLSLAAACGVTQSVAIFCSDGLHHGFMAIPDRKGLPIHPFSAIKGLMTTSGSACLTAISLALTVWRKPGGVSLFERSELIYKRAAALTLHTRKG